MLTGHRRMMLQYQCFNGSFESLIGIKSIERPLEGLHHGARDPRGIIGRCLNEWAKTVMSGGTRPAECSIIKATRTNEV
jgi:hypothetical protein